MYETICINAYRRKNASIYIYILDYIGIIIEGSLEVKLPTMWIDEKAEMGRGRERRRVEESRSEK